MCRDAASLLACWLRPAAAYHIPPRQRRRTRTRSKDYSCTGRGRRQTPLHPWIESITQRLNTQSESVPQQNTWLNYNMETGYDEDLSENTFFQALQQEHRPIFDRAVAEGWIICVPRCGTYIKSALTEEDFLDHILIPDDELPGTHFHTLTHREVRLNNRALTVEYDSAKPRTLKLLFEETFYSDDLSKYCVWCIEGLLEQEISLSSDDVPIVSTLKECVDLLWSEVLDKNILKDLDIAIDEFEKTHKNLENECLQMQRDLVNMLYSKSLKSLLKDTRLRERTMESRYFLQTVKVAIETYILHGLRRILPQAISNCTSADDANLNKIIKNLHDLHLNDFGVRPDLYDGVSRGKLELSRLDGNFTVLGKIGCLKRAVRFVSQGKSTVSSDDLLPVLIFLVVKSGLASWYAQITFMKQFRCSSSSTQEADEAGFLVTSLEAAVEHVKSGSLKIGCGPKERKLVNGKDNHVKSDTSNGIEDATELFEHVKKGNLTEVQKILSEKVETNAKDVKLCHPLCLCETCERSLSKTFLTEHPGLLSRDERGLTCLHLACSYGQASVVEYLLQQGADPNDTDSDGQTGLHCAAARGHQNTLLLLLHANANPNAIDSKGNSVLHVAADHGHETCVKALLYFAEQTRLLVNVSAMNLQGDTALHFASKWGYKSIVEILLEYGADPTSKNRRSQTPMTVAHSSHIVRLLEGRPMRNGIPMGPKCNGTIHKTLHAGNKKSSSKANSAHTLPSRISYRGSITDGMHKIERLFAAVAECDIRLASYYLGLEGPCSKVYISNNDDMQFCHPLCNCDKCISIEELSFERDSKPPIGINAINGKGETALHIAAGVGCLEIIQLLLDAGAKVNVVTRSDGRSPLHMACMHERVQAVKMLLDCGSCNPDVKDNARDSPLHLASRAGNVRIVEMLVRYGANHRLRNFNGFTPLDEVERIKSDDIFRSLAYSNIAKILKNITVAKTSQ